MKRITRKRAGRGAMRPALLVLPLLLLCSAGNARRQGGGALDAVRTIPLPGVEGRFDHFAVDLKGGRLFLAALGNNTLEVLDPKAGKVLTSVGGMREPQGVAFAPELDRVFVGNGSGGTCDLLDARTLARVAQVKELDDADNVRYDAAARQVFVGYDRGALAVLDAAAGKLLGKVPLAGHPESFQLERAGSRIWVNVPAAGQIAVVDRKQRKVTATWPVTGAAANFPMALDEARHRLFAGCRRPAKLLVFDTETGKQVAAVPIVGDTDDLYYDAARQRIYVIGGEGAVTVLEQQDADRYRELQRVPTAAGARTGYFVPDWSQLFVVVPHRGSQRAEVRVFRTG